jgi:hypothetical protein
MINNYTIKEDNFNNSKILDHLTHPNFNFAKYLLKDIAKNYENDGFKVFFHNRNTAFSVESKERNEVEFVYKIAKL